MVQKIPVLLVGLHVDGHLMLDTILDHLLDQGRGVDAAQDPVGD